MGTLTEDEKGLVNAYLFDHIWKVILLLLDGNINQVEQIANERVERSLKKIQNYTEAYEKQIQGL